MVSSEPFINDEQPFTPRWPVYQDMKQYLIVSAQIEGVGMCDLCGALVVSGFQMKHTEWHVKLQSALESPYL